MDSKYIINLQGKNFIKFEGLLSGFHENGGKSIETTELTNSTPAEPKFKATVTGEKGTYTGHGDANDKNVSSMIVRHKYRMAETRAIARALRWYLNIGECSVDELGGDETPIDDYQVKNQPARTAPVNNPAISETVNRLNGYKKNDIVDKCPICGADMKISQAGKPYCSALCWKK